MRKPLISRQKKSIKEPRNLDLFKHKYAESCTNLTILPLRYDNAFLNLNNQIIFIYLAFNRYC